MEPNFDAEIIIKKKSPNNTTHCMVSRSLIEDNSISIECRVMLMILISYDLIGKDPYITIAQIKEHVENEKISEEKLDGLIEEAVRSGYIKIKKEV